MVIESLSLRDYHCLFLKQSEVSDCVVPYVDYVFRALNALRGLPIIP